MATFVDGGRRRATANTVTAMVRSAERRRCPKCGRGSALVSLAEYGLTFCRWGETKPPKCDYMKQAR
jgi:hypothetical protein